MPCLRHILGFAVRRQMQACSIMGRGKLKRCIPILAFQQVGGAYLDARVGPNENKMRVYHGTVQPIIHGLQIVCLVVALSISCVCRTSYSQASYTLSSWLPFTSVRELPSGHCAKQGAWVRAHAHRLCGVGVFLLSESGAYRHGKRRFPVCLWPGEYLAGTFEKLCSKLISRDLITVYWVEQKPMGGRNASVPSNTAAPPSNHTPFQNVAFERCAAPKSVAFRPL